MQAAENDVHILGISSLAAGHKILVPDTLNALEALGRKDIGVVVGGIIPRARSRIVISTGCYGHLRPGHHHRRRCHQVA